MKGRAIVFCATLRDDFYLDLAAWPVYRAVGTADWAARPVYRVARTVYRAVGTADWVAGTVYRAAGTADWVARPVYRVARRIYRAARLANRFIT